MCSRVYDGKGSFSCYLLVIRVLPILALLFLCSFLDRTNVGNARILGLQDSLHLSDQQYSTGLAVFFATYIARSVTLYFSKTRV